MPRIIFCIAIIFATVTMSSDACAKSYWLRGLWIGALSGAVVGGGVTAGVFATKDCSDHIDSSDVSLCRGLQIGVPIGMAFLGAAVGAGVGAAVGSTFKKPETVALYPFLTPTKEGLIGGLNLRLQGF